MARARAKTETAETATAEPRYTEGSDAGQAYAETVNEGVAPVAGEDAGQTYASMVNEGLPVEPVEPPG